MMDYVIGITTFSKRFDLLTTLINQIRTHTDTDIILCVNGEHNQTISEDYRKQILTLCLENDRVYPTFFNETRGLSKMWNTIVTLSNNKNILMLNDDLKINNGSVFTEINNHVNSPSFTGITRINRSFSHFLIDKVVLDKIGYFDERLLGFGEEDGDIFYRLLKNNINLVDVRMNGFINLVAQSRHDHITSGIRKYSKYNRDYIYGEKYTPNPNSKIKGLFDSTMEQLIQDVNAYPHEKYFMDNKNKL